MAKDKRLQRLNEMAGILRDGGAASAGAQQQTAASKANKVRQLAASAAARTKGTIAGRTAAPAQAPQQAAPTKASPAFDMLAYKELVNRMLAGGQTATAGIAHPTLPKQAAGLYDATQSFQATGGAKPPMSYDDLVRRYYANAPAEGQATMAALAGRGGWQTLTPEEIAAMTSQDSYMPGEGVSAWDWIVNPDVRGGMREGYVNMLTNAQAATAHGVFDTPQYLLGGQVQYVSDDYLQHMMQILPGLIEQEEVDYPARLAAEEAAADFVQAALAPSDANVSILYMYGALDELDEEDPLGFEQALIAAAGTEVEPEESEAAYTAALTQLVAFDNVLHGSDVTVDGLLQMSGEERTAEVRRMVDDYYRYILAYEEFDPGLFPGKYPYAAVQEMVQTEAAAREALTPYVAQMMADPNVYALTEYDPLKYSDDDAYLVYQQVNADPSGTTITTNGFNLMTDVERAVYNYYYNTDNHGTAMAYIEVMRPILEARYRTMEQADWEYLATDNIFTGALMAAGSVGANVLSGVTMPLDVIAGLMGAGDGRANAFADFTQTVRTSQEEALGEHDWLGLEFFGRNIPQLLYSAGMSTADMGAAIALGNAMGINPLHIMAMEAAGAEYASTAGSGMSIPERAIRAGLVGGTEILTEKLPLDILTSDPTAPGYILRSILSEGIEEGVSEIAGIGIDAVISFAFDHASEVEDRYTFLRMNGYENAAQIVLGELAQQVGLASTVGGLAGGGMAAGSAAANFGVNALQGRGVKTAGGVERLLELGQAMGTDTTSFTLATQLAEAMGGQGKAGTGQRVSAAKLGQLYRTMLTETVSQYHDDIRGMTVDAVMQALEDKYASLGEMLEGEYANNPRAIAEAIVDAKGNPNAMRGALAQYIKSHRGTREVMQEFREGSAAWQRQLHEQQIGRQIGMIQQVSAIEATKTKAKGSEVQPTGETIAEETTARVQQLTRRKKSSEIPSQDVIIREGDGQQKATIKRVERQRSGLRLIVDKGGEEVAVTMDQVEEISGTGTARVIAYAEGRPEVSDNEINAMIRMVNEQELDSSRVIAAFEAGTNAGYASAERPDMAAIIAGVKKADADALRRIMEMGYEAGSAERTTTEETRLQKAKGRKGSRAEARVSYIGDFSTMAQVSEGGVHLSTERIRGQLDAQQNAAIDVMTQVSKALGVNVAFYRSTAERGEAVEMPNGWYDDATTTVYIDLNAGANEGGQGAVQRAIIQTAAHELTHFIEANSEGGYSQLRDIARQHLTRDGVGYMDLVLDKVRKSKQQLSRAQAEAEVIADACELMLTNSQVMQEVVKQNRSIARKVASFVKTFVRRLRRAMGVIAPTTHESAMLTKEKDGVLQYAQELQSAWDRALLEAAGYQAEAPSTEGAQAVMDAAGQSAAAAAVVAQQTMHRATVSVTDRVPAVEKVAKAAAEGVAEQLADESGAGVTLPMAEAMVTEVAEAAVSAVQDAAATMAQRMDADAYLQRAADVADEVTKDMGPQAREYANAIALTTMGTYTGETPMEEELQDAMDDTSAYAQELGLTGEQQDEIRDGILQRLQTMARELGMADVQGSFEAQVLETATDKAVSTALAVYTGGRSNVAGMMEAMARRAAREAVEQQLFEQTVADAGRREQMAEMARTAQEEAARDGQSVTVIEGAGVVTDERTGTAYMPFSERTWRDSEYVKRKKEMALVLAKRTGVTEQQAADWIDDVTGVANMIANNRSILDYVPSRFSSPFKSNPEYGGTIDFSTLCPKRAIATATLDAIQRIIGDKAMGRDDFIEIRRMMQERGYEVACGLCFVESSRANMSKYVEDFIAKYRKANPDAVVTMPMLNTVDGLEQTRETNYPLYEAFEQYMNKLAQRKPKLFEKRSEYTDEILLAFMRDTTVTEKNRMGGLRIQSFSDFEVIHLIDMMQVITDMSAVGLAGQAYTKQPNFARALGNTRLKINLSLIAKGVGPDGRLIFDPVEGMDPDVAMELRSQYSKNVGTIVVVFTNEQIVAAMADPRVDFIIPFHRSQWKKSDYSMLGLPARTRDYTLHQNERHMWKDERGKWHTTKVTEGLWQDERGEWSAPAESYGNYMPNDYWDFDVSGTENARRYLEMCNAAHRIPKFPFLLKRAADGTYHLKDDGTTDGYWKLLIDFKMYDNDGVGSPQESVIPEFNMEECYKMLREYKGGHDSVAPAQDVVQDFVAKWMKKRDTAGFRGIDIAGPGVQFSERAATAPSLRQTLMDMDPEGDMTQVERALLTRYQADVREYGRLQEEIDRQTQILNSNPDKDEERAARNRMGVLKSQQRRVENRLYKAEKNGGFARLISRYSDMVRAYMAGDTAEAAAQRIAVSIRAAEEQLKALRGKGGDVSPEALEDALVQLVDKKQMAEAVKVIRSTWATKMTSDEIRRRLVVYHAMMIDSDLTKGDELKAYLEQWVRDMAEKSDRTSETGAYTLDLIRAHLAGELIIDEGVAEEIRRSVGSIAEYRRVVGSVLGTVRLAKAHEKGTADSLAEEAPEWVRSTLFGDATNEADIAVQLYHVIKKAKAAEDVYAGAEGAEQMAAEVAQLIEIAEGASIRENATGRAQKILQQLRTARGKQAVTDTIIDSVIADLREARGKAREFARKGSVRDVINYLTRLERQAALQTELEQLHRMQERLDDTVRAWYAERELMEERRKLHGAIRRQVEWMDKRIRRETDRDRIPEGLKPVVDEAMRIFLAANDALQVFPRKQVEAIRGIYERVRTLHGDDLHQMDDLLQADLEDALDQLRLKLDAYAETAKTASRMDRLRARVDVLKDIQDVVMEIRKAVDDADNLLIGGQQKKLAEVTAELERELVARKDYSVAAWGGKAWESIKRLMRDGNLTPPYFFRWLGSKVMTALNQDLLDAQSKHAKLFAQAQERIAEIQKKHNYWAWRDRAPLTFVTQQGVMSGEADKHRVTLTADEALSLWVTWQREQASSPLVSSFHLPDGGFVLASKERRTKDGRIVYDGTPHKITLADMAIIGDYLTKEMRDYADEMVRYLSTDMARLGNEVSMQLFGINKYTESYYFPMRVAGGQLDESSTAARRANDETNRIAGMSASKRRVDKATKALVIGGFTDVAAQHVHNMLLYNTFSIPIENFNRILNQIHKTSDDDETASKMNMRGLLEQKIGQDMTDYLRTYLADVNGGPMADRRGKGFWNKTVSLYKRSAVMASLAVAVQQPLSMIRAMMVMPARYFVPILRNKDKVKVRKEWEQLKQYSGTALIKERGGFDMTGGRGLAAQLAGNPEDVYTLRRTVADAAKAFTEGTEGERAKRAKTAAGAIGRRGENLAGFLANKADQVAWTYIWVAVKAETADRYKGMDVESDAFLELAAKRFDEVINLTQVYDSTLVRSHNMRDKSVWMQMVTSFMAEPTLTANILMDAARQKSPKAMGKAAVIFLASQVLTAAVKAVVTAGRDDDEEKPWLEKYLAAVGSQLFGLGGSLNVLNLFPWVQDAISIIEGYDVERADMSVIDTLYTEISKLLAGKYDDKPYAAVENLGGAVATMLGLPLKNILRDARTLWNTAEHVLTEGRDVSGTAIMDDLAANMALLPDRDNGWYGERLFRALESGDEAEVAELREYLAITGKSESAIDDMVRGVIKTRLLTGQMSADEAKSFLVEHGLAADNKAAYTYVDRWTEAVDHMTEDGTLEEGYSYSAYNSLYEAIDGGNVPDVNAVVKELKANGYLTDKGTIKSTLRNRYRDTFRDLYRTNRTAFASLQNMLIAAMVAAGVSRSDAQEYLRGWLQD